MTTRAKCVVCESALDGDEWDNHMALNHPEFERDWFGSVRANNESSEKTIREETKPLADDDNGSQTTAT